MATPTEAAFTYAVTLTTKVADAQSWGTFAALAALDGLAKMDSGQISQWIDMCQKQVGSVGPTLPKLAYVPPAGQYMVNGEHLTLKVSKNHGGMLVFEKYAGYLGALAAPKLAAIAEALGTATKAQAACIAYAAATGKCGVCNTKLKDPASIAAGIGPVCAKKYS